MSRGLRSLLVVQALVIAALLTVSLDVYAHKRVEQLGGVNIWGYRGATARVKKANEIRLAVVGGTVAFGWGVAASETTIAGVRQLVALAMDRRGQTATPVTAVNLGAIAWPASSYADRLRQFAGLGFDVVCVYPDPDGTSPRTPLPSRVLASGYAPILPLVLREKFGMTPAATPAAQAVVAPASLEEIAATVAVGLSMARGVVVVLPAPAPGRLTSGWEPLPDRFAGNPRVRVVDLSQDPRLQDRAVRLDDNSFGAGGNAAAAEQIAPAVIELLRRER